MNTHKAISVEDQAVRWQVVRRISEPFKATSFSIEPDIIQNITMNAPDSRAARPHNLVGRTATKGETTTSVGDQGIRPPPKIDRISRYGNMICFRDGVATKLPWIVLDDPLFG